MASHRIRARPPRGMPAAPTTRSEADELAVYLQDAAHTPGGHASSVVLPKTEAELSHALRTQTSLLPVGAQSSLTGGATPFGGCVVSLARLDATFSLERGCARVGAGLSLLALERELRARRLFYPPTPTFTGASLGGTAATNASGAATFKYGSTRAWIRALTVVLANGEVLELERGECHASADGHFEVVLTGGEALRVAVPTYSMPKVAKRSAGYHAEPGMDLLDLFVGSEGTLGVITEVAVGLLAEPVRVTGWCTFPSESAALAAVGALRDASRATWSARDPHGIDVAAIESIDRRGLQLLREDGKDRDLGVRLEPSADTAILFQAELPAGLDAGLAMDQIGRLDEADAPDTPLTRLCRLLREHGALESLELALPGDLRRADQLRALREAVPSAVNHRIGLVQRAGDAEVRKTAADMIVPFEHLPEMMVLYREAFVRRGLDHALWGHVSDGNIHANVLPRSGKDVRSGEEAILELGVQAVRLGGCPLSEHGVGRNAGKQQLLRLLYGDDGIAQMRRVKAALDPEWKLSSGVLFSR